MSTIDLNTLLKLVGPLDDSTDPNSASLRFRTYLQENVHGVHDLRAYVTTALSTSGDQFNRALQDLANHAGSLLGFEVEYGRYRGVQGQIGFDGLWRSPTGRTLVVETKTTDVYAVKTATLLGYINALVSEGQISSPDEVIGLYVYGRFDADTSQLEKAIASEKRQDRLRVISMDALLNLLQLKQEYDLKHEAAFQLMLPFPIRIDTIVNLIYEIATDERRVWIGEEAPSEGEAQDIQPRPKPRTRGGRDTLGLVKLDQSYRGKKPRAFVFRGTRHEVESWREVLLQLYGELCRLHPGKFEEIALAWRGRKRRYFSRAKGDLRTPLPVPNSDGLYAEANLSANSIVKHCRTMVERMGYNRSDLDFET
jgi:hypothetical protein